MNPLYIDIVLLVITILFMFGGWRSGFIKAAGNLLGLVISIGLSIYGVTWIEDLTGYNLTQNPIVFVIVFLVLTLIISQILRLIVNAVDLVRRLFSIIPFVGLINSLFGMLLGAVQAALLILGLAYVTVKYLPDGVIQNTLLASESVGLAVELLQRVGWL